MEGCRQCDGMIGDKKKRDGGRRLFHNFEQGGRRLFRPTLRLMDKSQAAMALYGRELQLFDQIARLLRRKIFFVFVSLHAQKVRMTLERTVKGMVQEHMRK